MASKIGEIVEATTTAFTAQSYELHVAPAFGSLVRTSADDLDVYGVTAHVMTSSLEPGRRPIVRGRDEPTLADLFRNHPQIPRLLRTEFVVLILGFRANGVVAQHLPPLPPPIHAFVYPCEPAEISAFTERLDFLPLLLKGHGDVPADELICAFLRHAFRARGDDRAFLVAAGKAIARLVGGDVVRLNDILRRIRP